MARKIYMTVQVETIIVMDEDVNIEDIMDDMQCTLVTDESAHGCDIVDVSISDYKVTDSK